MHQAMQTVVQRKHAAHRKKQRLPLRLYLRESGPALAGKFGEAFLFFFLSLSECFRLPSPFAVCALCAWLYTRRGLLFPAAGLLLSLGLRLLWGVAIDPMQYAGCALLMMLRFHPPRAVWIASAWAACALSLRCLMMIFSPGTQEDMILCTVSLIVGVLCTPAFCHAAALAQERRARVRIDDLLCCLVLAAVLLCGAGRVAIGMVNIGFALAGLAILLSACVGGCTAAVCAGLIAGIALSLCGHADGYAVCFAFSGIVCGLFYGRKRWVLGAIYLLCGAFTSYAVHFSMDYSFMAAAALSCVVFLLLPRRMVSTVYASVRRMSPDAADNASAYAQCMRAQWTGNLLRLSQLLPPVRVGVPDEEEQLEDVMERMCTGCELLPRCWHEKSPETKALLSEYFLHGDRTARMADCPRLEAWPALALDCERAAQQRALRCAYAQREREATRTHLSAIAQAMGDLSDGRDCDRDDDALIGEAAYLLRRMRVPGRLLYALRIHQHVSLALRFESPLTSQRMLERYCGALSQQLDLPLHIARRSKDTVQIEETPPLMVECYHLSASAGNGCGENGDSLLLRSAPGGTELSMLSDGMGHGGQAHEESEKTLELLSLCLDSGYDVPQALSAINCIMLSSTDGEQYATVDLCVSDLWQGKVTLDKLGACPSMVICGDTLRVLESSALPLGILPAVQSSTHSFAVDENDMVIQFTDGLADACGGMRALEGQVQLFMRDRLHRSPETLCTALMSAAMRRCGGVPQDDMTVCCTLFKRRKSRKRETETHEGAGSFN